MDSTRFILQPGASFAQTHSSGENQLPPSISGPPSESSEDDDDTTETSMPCYNYAALDAASHPLGRISHASAEAKTNSNLVSAGWESSSEGSAEP